VAATINIRIVKYFLTAKIKHMPCFCFVYLHPQLL
jgi:hypothetical protein